MARKRIGIQTARLEYGYSVGIWRGAVACAEKLDVDLVVFPGRNLEAPHDFDSQYNRIFTLMSRENLDALILVTTLVANYIDETALRDFCSSFTSLPLVSVGLAVSGVPSIVIDNRSGVRNMVGHLVERHGCRRIAFVKGPAGNWEASERFLAYKEELGRRGIAFDESLVGQGDFTTHSVRPAIRGILDRCGGLPDAFFFANDEMAIKGMQILRELGYSVPVATKIVGFDDIGEASTLATPLSTIRQPLFDMACKAVETAVRLVEGLGAPELLVLGAEPVVRSSCGCLAHCVEDLVKLERIMASKAAREDGEAACHELAIRSLREGRFEHIRDIDGREAGIRGLISDLAGLAAIEKGRSADQGGEAEEQFFSVFGELLKEDTRAGRDASEWQYIVSAVEEAINRVLASHIDSRRLRFLSQACSVLAAETEHIARKAAHFESVSLNLVLHGAQYSLSSIMRAEDLVEALKRQLPRLGIPSFFLSRFDREWSREPGRPWEPPESIRLVAGFVDGAELALPEGEIRYSSALLLPPKLYQETRRRTMAVYPLFFRESHYGTLLVELTHQSGFVYESLATQVSGILKAITLYNAKESAEENLRRAMMELESFNEQLSNLSLTDELTGLYNRRGFMKLATQQLSITKQMGKNALLIFGDIDGLKAINDVYGHAEGDFAIKSAADILRKVFRTMDVIARLGGDEFTVFASNTNEKQIGYFESRMAELLNTFNAESGREYRLSISLGCAECAPGSESSLGDFMREADSRLYERKAANKARSTSK